MKIKHLLIIFTLLLLVAIESCKKSSDEETQPTPTPASNAMSSRDSAVADYNANYLGSAFSSSPGWTGSTVTCTGGTISAAAHTAAINRINYFRKLVGLNSCTMDTTVYSQEQQVALMQDAHGSLSHVPDVSWACYTAAGASGSMSSNLAAGGIASTAIDLFINDFGTGNQVCGHRRWILHSPRSQFSDGSTNSYYALYVWGAATNTTFPAYIAYPPKGYIARNLVYGRWSFGIPGSSANFAAATVTMTGPSGSVPLSIVSSTDNGYGDNTIVWEPTGINTSSSTDVSYTITVSGISGVSPTIYTYTVTLFAP
jgi:hypothetical protein